MIKKIKDLTREEFEKICGKNSCDYCPLDLDGTRCRYSDLEHYGDEEIEVDEDEKEELKETLNKTRKMGLEIIEEKKQLSNELHKLNCYRNIELAEISKLKKVIKILKRKKVHIKWLLFSHSFTQYNLLKDKKEEKLTKEEYELLKEVLGDDK